MSTHVDETVTSKPLPSTDIERDRKRALALYEDGAIGYRRLQSWMKRLDEQEAVRSTIADSLEDSEQAIADTPIKRDAVRAHSRPRRHKPQVSKFARSL